MQRTCRHHQLLPTYLSIRTPKLPPYLTLDRARYLVHQNSHTSSSHFQKTPYPKSLASLSLSLSRCQTPKKKKTNTTSLTISSFLSSRHPQTPVTKKFSPEPGAGGGVTVSRWNSRDPRNRTRLSLSLKIAIHQFPSHHFMHACLNSHSYALPTLPTYLP